MWYVLPIDSELNSQALVGMYLRPTILPEGYYQQLSNTKRRKSASDASERPEKMARVSDLESHHVSPQVSEIHQLETHAQSTLNVADEQRIIVQAGVHGANNQMVSTGNDQIEEADFVKAAMEQDKALDKTGSEISETRSENNRDMDSSIDSGSDIDDEDKDKPKTHGKSRLWIILVAFLVLVTVSVWMNTYFSKAIQTSVPVCETGIKELEPVSKTTYHFDISESKAQRMLEILRNLQK